MPRLDVRIVALLLLVPASVGCLGEEPAPLEETSALSPADAGEKSGAAPVAPKEAYALKDERTAHPVAVPTTPAREPLTIDMSGEFRPSDCRPFGFGPLEPVLAPASHPFRPRDLSDELRVGDVFSYNITLSFTNSAQNWAEVELAYGLGSTVRQSEEPTQGQEEIVVSFEGQGLRADESDMAWVVVDCEYGVMTSAIPYTLTATFSFAEGAVPAEAPMLLTVPEGATRLFVRGVPIDPDAGVLSHFRVFRPDDTLLCECALGSDEEVAEVELDGPGDHVIIVDHTDNGFVSIALDAPAPAPLRPLASEWVQTPVLAAERGSVDTAVELTLDRVPLLMFAYVVPKDGAGAGKGTALSVTNSRGEPLRMAWGGHLAWSMPSGGNAWLGFWPEGWEFEVDHHAFAEGQHVAHVQAEELRGQVVLITRHYVR